MKKNTITLDIDLESDSHDGSALLLFHSIAPNYAFVDDLNHLYNLRLSRIDDLLLDDTPYPHFTYYDSLHQLQYNLLERPLTANAIAPLWSPGHKMLIITGQLAVQTATNIHNEFNNAPSVPPEDDFIAARHLAILDQLRSNFTTTTLLDPLAAPPSTLRGKALRDYNDLFTMADTILDTLDIKYFSDI